MIVHAYMILQQYNTRQSVILVEEKEKKRKKNLKKVIPRFDPSNARSPGVYKYVSLDMDP